MILVIDTHTGEETGVAIARADGSVVVTKHKKNVQFDQSRHVLPLIEQAARAADTAIADLTGIVVAQGAGGFTALRIGIATANALAYALDIPAVGISGTHPIDQLARQGAQRLRRKKKVSLVVPHYGREPNITTPHPVHIRG